MFGLINLNKPAGFTSHDCVAKLRRLLNIKKIGHGGTLDPAATGVLPIAVGKATRLLQFLPKPKAYRAGIRLGLTTTTDDLEGEILTTSPTADLTKAQVVAGLKQFVGAIAQVPPMYSAIKRDGKKLYELARKGESVDIPARTILIEKIELLNFVPGEAGEVEVEIRCSPGTYIRAIARDLGKLLGVGGTLAYLIRTESCGLQLDTSLTFAELETQLQQNSFSLIPPESLLTYLPSVTLPSNEAQRWCQGQAIQVTAINNGANNSSLKPEHDYVLVYGEDNLFLGISIVLLNESGWLIKPKVVLYQFNLG